MLLDPRSKLFDSVARIFKGFEEPYHLTIYQPEGSRLTVELRRLELNFFVNNNNLLQCRQLHAEIVKDQDAGCWYGLSSLIVLGDVTNPAQRSIIVPLAIPVVRRNQFHASVFMPNQGLYGQYSINTVLKRLDCTPVPWLMYIKAALHAFTSFVVPDPLTGRTGVEESLSILRSGAAVPWAPLNESTYNVLSMVARLTPRRVYYPRNLRKMQQVFWDPSLPSSTQHSDFLPLSEELLGISRRLAVFAPSPVDYKFPHQPPSDDHLLERAQMQRHLHDRNADQPRLSASDQLYTPRADIVNHTDWSNILETTTLLSQWRGQVWTSMSLRDCVASWSVIGGYDRAFDKFLLNDLLDVNFQHEWGPLVRTCLLAQRKDVFNLMFMFALMAYGQHASMDIIKILIAIATSRQEVSITLPIRETYSDIEHYIDLDVPAIADRLRFLIQGCELPYSAPEDDASKAHFGLKWRQKVRADKDRYEKLVEQDCSTFIQHLLDQWPCAVPSFEGLDYGLLIDIERAASILLPEWDRLFKNFEFIESVEQIQTGILDLQQVDDEFKPPSVPTRRTQAAYPYEPTWKPSLFELCSQAPDIELPALNGTSCQSSVPAAPKLSLPLQSYGKPKSRLGPATELNELGRIVNELKQSSSEIKRKYATDLGSSLQAFRNKRLEQIQEPALPSDLTQESIRRRISRAKTEQAMALDQIRQMMESKIDKVRWLHHSNLWPPVTPCTLLELLRSTSPNLPKHAEDRILHYALCTTKLQRFMRIEEALRKNDVRKVREEYNNRGQNYSPSDYPDWILLEIDANILIRPDQVKVARATISPPDAMNSCFQMNMGQGKTSTIIPMAAAVLANGEALARVIVPEALLQQTAQTLQSRLGGLLGRGICHVPWSRRTPTDQHTVRTFLKIHEGVRQRCGVMVSLPGHILSFRLSGQQRLLDDRTAEADMMVKTQTLLTKSCRDVLDECDHTLAVRTQLIYPSGAQMAIDGHPHRWEVAECLLQLVNEHLWTLQKQFPKSIEVVQSSQDQARFPAIYFQRQDVQDALLNLLVKDVLRDRIPWLQTSHFGAANRHSLKRFISDATLTTSDVEKTEELFRDKVAAKQCLYLIRGLLVHRILLLVLRKRYQVHYGLHDPSRTLLAVPYHAKGVPSEQAEWGHPDVAILFTTLSFYYQGLSNTQLQEALENVAKIQDPSAEFDRWIRDSESLPATLRDWCAINPADKNQVGMLGQYVRYKVELIDYYLNHFVFPQYAKQFKTKLQASGWDIPLFLPRKASTNPGLRTCSRSMTTGFSGTNDNKTLLPMTIHQADLPGLSHTNAEVLTYLLQPRNRRYVLAADNDGRHISERTLLGRLRDWKVRVLIDAGAQILEMDNKSLVEAWLEIDYAVPAAVYFQDNKPWVMYRGGNRRQPLFATPYAENLSNCLVYLDQAHTRGTDLKIPTDATGVLTLGPGQSKDATVQAAMRLRQLATTQSIIFVAPPEVHQSILDLREKQSHEKLDSHDVVCWLLEQTCTSIESLHPLYFTQGSDFCHRSQSALDNPDHLADDRQRNEYLQCIQHNELQTLRRMYRPRSKKDAQVTPSTGFAPGLQAFMDRLNQIRKQFEDGGHAVHSSALEEVEQEREVAYEVESVREVQKPIVHQALKFGGLHRNIRRFIETGTLIPTAEGYEYSFHVLQRSEVGRKRGVCIDWNPMSDAGLFLSQEFSRTIRLQPNQVNDNYLRNINFLLLSTLTNTALAITPEEANLAMPILRQYRQSTPTRLLLYAPPITKRMLHFNTLDFYAFPPLPSGWQAPPWLQLQLGIFAGRLYFRFEEYDRLLHFLGIDTSSGRVIELDEQTLEVEDSSAVSIDSRKALPFTKNPLTLLQEWLAVRRKGQDFTNSPMGVVCRGRPLTEDHHFFLNPAKPLQGGPEAKPTGATSILLQEDDKDADTDSDDDIFPDIQDEEGEDREESYDDERADLDQE